MKSRKIILPLILLIFVFSSMITASVAWFANYLKVEIDHETGLKAHLSLPILQGVTEIKIIPLL
jgi:hypothetical protein